MCCLHIIHINIYIYMFILLPTNKKSPSHTQAWRTISSSTPSLSTDSSAMVSLHTASARCRTADSQSPRVTSLDLETVLEGAATHSFGSKSRQVIGSRHGTKEGGGEGSDFGDGGCCCCGKRPFFETKTFWSWNPNWRNGMISRCCRFFWSEITGIDRRVHGRFFSEHSRIKSDPQIYPRNLFYQFHTSPNAHVRYPYDFPSSKNAKVKRSHAIRDFVGKNSTPASPQTRTPLEGVAHDLTPAPQYHRLKGKVGYPFGEYPRYLYQPIHHLIYLLCNGWFLGTLG